MQPKQQNLIPSKINEAKTTKFNTLKDKWSQNHKINTLKDYKWSQFESILWLFFLDTSIPMWSYHVTKCYGIRKSQCAKLATSDIKSKVTFFITLSFFVKIGACNAAYKAGSSVLNCNSINGLVYLNTSRFWLWKSQFALLGQKAILTFLNYSLLRVCICHTLPTNSIIVHQNHKNIF